MNICGLEIVVSNLGAAQARWGRLSQQDYKGITSIDGLVAAVARRYDLPLERAAREVDGWVGEVTGRPRSFG